MPRDYYEVLGVAARRGRGDDQEGLPPARARAAPGRQRARPGGRGEVQGGRRGLRGALGRRAPPDLRRLRPRGPAKSGGFAPNFEGFGSISDLFSAFFGAGRVRRGVRRPRHARRRGPGRRRRAWRSRSTSPRPRTGTRSRSPTTPRRSARPATATAPSRARRSSPATRCRGAGQIQAVQRTRFGQMVRTALCDVCGGDGRDRRAALPHLRRRAGWWRARARVKVDVPAGIADGQRIRVTGRGHAGERGGPAGRPVRRRARRARTSASSATARTS